MVLLVAGSEDDVTKVIPFVGYWGVFSIDATVVDEAAELWLFHG